MRRILMVAAVVYFTLTSAAWANALAEAEHQIQREFRFFRIQVYNSFRTARPEFDSRRKAGEEALSLWKQAGGQLHQTEPLLQWYRDAKAVSQPGVNQPLPPLPEFPEAVVSNTNPQAKSLNAQPVSPPYNPFDPPDDEKKLYHVREVATRSTANPDRVAPPQPAAKSSGTTSAKKLPVWQRVSRAFLKTMSLGGSASNAGK